MVKNINKLIDPKIDKFSFENISRLKMDKFSPKFSIKIL